MKRKTWQKKLPPAFNEIVRRFNSTISHLLKESNDGSLELLHNPEIKSLFKKLGFPCLEKLYEADNISELAPYNLNEQFKLDQLTQLPSKHNPKEREETITSQTSIMDAENSDYYRKWLGNIPPYGDTRIYLDYISDILALKYHYEMLAEIPELENASVTLDIINMILFSAIAIRCQIIYKEPLPDIYKKAKAGDDTYLFKLLALDKTIFDYPWVRDRIKRAYFGNEGKFWENMAKALREKKSLSRKIRLDLHLVLTHFWICGLYRLTMPELMDLLEDSGIRLDVDETTFRKFVDREIKKQFDFSHLQ